MKKHGLTGRIFCISVSACLMLSLGTGTLTSNVYAASENTVQDVSVSDFSYEAEQQNTPEEIVSPDEEASEEITNEVSSEDSATSEKIDQTEDEESSSLQDIAETDAETVMEENTDAETVTEENTDAETITEENTNAETVMEENTDVESAAEDETVTVEERADKETISEAETDAGTVMVNASKAEQAAPDASLFTVQQLAEGMKTISITGVNSTMEYSTDGGKTYTLVGKTNVIRGIYPVQDKVLIRYRETEEYKASPATAVVIPVYVEVQFNVLNRCAAPLSRLVKADSKIDRPSASLSAENYTFTGKWYTDPYYKTEFNFDSDLAERNMTLYGKWVVSQDYLNAAKNELIAEAETVAKEFDALTYLSDDEKAVYMEQIASELQYAENAVDTYAVGTTLDVDNTKKEGLKRIRETYSVGAEVKNFASAKEQNIAKLQSTLNEVLEIIADQDLVREDTRKYYKELAETTFEFYKQIINSVKTVKDIESQTEYGCECIRDVADAAKDSECTVLRNKLETALAQEQNFYVKTIDALAFLSDDDKDTYESYINNAASSTIENMNSADTVEKIIQAYKKGPASFESTYTGATSADRTAQLNYKSSVYTELDAYEQNAENAIDAMAALENSEKENLKEELSGLDTDAKTSIAMDTVATIYEVDQLADSGKKAMDDLVSYASNLNYLTTIFNNEQELAELKEQYENEISNMAYLTADGINNYLSKLNDAYNTAIDNTQNAATADAAAKAGSDGKVAMKAVLDEARTANMNAAGTELRTLLKNQEARAESAISNIENLYESQKTDFQTQAKNAMNDAIKQINAASDIGTLEKAAADGLTAITKAVTDAGTQADQNLANTKKKAVDAIDECSKNLMEQVMAMEDLTDAEKSEIVQKKAPEIVKAAKESIEADTTVAKVIADRIDAVDKLNALLTLAKNTADAKVVPTAEDFVFSAPENAKYDGTTAWAASMTRKNDEEAVVAPASLNQESPKLYALKTGSESEMGAVTLWYSSDQVNWTKNAPVNAGTYHVKADVALTKYNKAATGITDPSWLVTVAKRSVSLTSGSASKKYNGTVLTNKSITVGGDGFVSGEGAEYTFTGTQTQVGSSANTFTYSLNAKTNSDNYDIACTYGILTVDEADTPVEPTPSVDPEPTVDPDPGTTPEPTVNPEPTVDPDPAIDDQDDGNSIDNENNSDVSTNDGNSNENSVNSDENSAITNESSSQESNSVNTGDTANTSFWFLLILIAAAGFIVVFIIGKRRNTK